MMAHARAELPQEACGLLLGQPGHIQQARPARNVAENPETRFEIDPAVLLAVHRIARAERLAVIGHYHSHPNGKPEPSKRDAARAVENGQIWIIVTDAGLTAWSATTSGALHVRFQPLALEHV